MAAEIVRMVAKLGSGIVTITGLRALAVPAFLTVILGYVSSVPFTAVALEEGLEDLSSWLDGQIAYDRVAESRHELAARGLMV